MIGFTSAVPDMSLNESHPIKRVLANVNKYIKYFFITS
ncbi:hypothetical protein M069_5227 [Bacteroides fragilis str. B1 (UDC16-1)]|nr:hypothetical protein M069_5227 [Bacteroides fragilis str. B1 (UDC16-1)]